MSEARCPRCGAKLAESVDGKVIITCRKCRIPVILHGEVKLTASVKTT